MRLIDADALHEYICSSIDEMTKIGVMVDGEYLWGLINEGIENAPTIEPTEWIPCSERLPSVFQKAVVGELVRCKECKKAHLTYDGECKYCDEWKDDDGNYIEVYHDGNHYCSYGERKESE